MIRNVYPGSWFFFHSGSGSRDQKVLVSRPGSATLIAGNHLWSQGCGFGPPWTGCQRCFSKMDQIQIRILSSRVDRNSTVQYSSRFDTNERVLNDLYEDQAFSPSQARLTDTQEDWERETTCWRARGGGGSGRGTESYDRMAVWSPINHSIRYGVPVLSGVTFMKPRLRIPTMDWMQILIQILSSKVDSTQNRQNF